MENGTDIRRNETDIGQDGPFKNVIYFTLVLTLFLITAKRSNNIKQTTVCIEMDIGSFLLISFGKLINKESTKQDTSTFKKHF